MWSFEVSYDLASDVTNGDAALMGLAGVHGLEQTGSGSGMGRRDIAFQGSADAVLGFISDATKLRADLGIFVYGKVGEHGLRN